MKHTIGSQGVVVPFGYVTLKDGRVFQQGQAIPPGEVVVTALGDSEVDPERNTAKLMEFLGIKKGGE